jgi:hypothetical protein
MGGPMKTNRIVRRFGHLTAFEKWPSNAVRFALEDVLETTSNEGADPLLERLALSPVQTDDHVHIVIFLNWRETLQWPPSLENLRTVLNASGNTPAITNFWASYSSVPIKSRMRP